MVEKDALEQIAAGANVLDVNAGVPAPNPNETEPPLLKKTIELVQGLVDAPLSIDSSVTEALKVGLEVCKGRPLVNSVTGEEEKLEAVLPLVKKYDVPVVAISNDETGISEDPDVRFDVAKKIVERAADFGIKPHDIVVDPLVMQADAPLWVAITIVGGTTVLSVLIHCLYALAFSTEVMPMLGARETIVFGEGVPLSSRIVLDEVAEDSLPARNRARFATAWAEDIDDSQLLSRMIKRWRRTSAALGDVEQPSADVAQQPSVPSDAEDLAYQAEMSSYAQPRIYSTRPAPALEPQPPIGSGPAPRRSFGRSQFGK